ncbi:MAG TPA: ribbon-helix-helix protein, CopG family [Candidatus Methylomirabilis sp.]|nr:ribbon-helix-helix protein, CopG family [Candidatus Methylomirabilis sp.]
MRRTTVFVEDKVLDALRAIARRRGITLAEVTREALSAYVSKRRDGGKSLSIIGIGRSGRRDIAERAEELLKEGFGR